MIEKKINQYKFHNPNLSILIFVGINILIALFISISAIANGGYVLLSILSYFYLFVILLPIPLTKFNWAHPLMIHMLLMLMQGISLTFRATGYLPLDFYRFYDGYVHADLEMVLMKTIIVNSLGLMILYFFAMVPRFKLKKVCLELKQSKSIKFLLVVAWGSFYVILSKIGSIGYIISNYQKRLTTFTSESIQYYVYLTQLGTLAGLYFYLMEKKKVSFLIFTIQIVISLVLGDRGQIVFNILIPLVIITHYYYKKVSLKKLIILFVIVLTSYQVLGNLRSTGVVSSNVNNAWAAVLNLFEDVEHFGITANVIHIVDSNQVSYLLGKPLINIIFAPFPRSIFPWKPTFIAESALVGSLIYKIDHFYIGLPPGLFGYGYLNFGWIGVIIFSIITGIIVNVFYNKLIGFNLKNRDSIPNGNLLIYVSFVNLIVNPLSTEVQIKALMAAIPLMYIFMFAKKKK